MGVDIHAKISYDYEDKLEKKSKQKTFEGKNCLVETRIVIMTSKAEIFNVSSISE